jgi:asparagine synthase (glutamine-hydrolysing)
VSAIAGCYWRRREPAHIDDLLPSIRAAAHRTRVPFEFWSSGPAALAYSGDDLEPLPRIAHDPLLELTAILDGRIDNLTEAASALDVAGSEPPARIALHAYRRWGLDAGCRLLGDFVLVLYDEQRQRLIGIRDPMGQRPLFYGACARGIVIGSEVAQIVRHPSMTLAINEGMVAEHLTDTPATINETLWRNVYRVPPAHTLEIDHDGVRVQRFWDFDPELRVVHPTDDGYAEQFRELFTRAIDDRIRGAAHVGVFLSGGLDSSCVAGVAQEIRARAAQAPIAALTLAYPTKPCDETAYSAAVVQKWKLPCIRLEAVGASHRHIDAQAARYLDAPPHPTSTLASSLRQAAEASGMRVVLTGYGGDESFTGDPPHAADLFRQRHIIRWAREVVSRQLPARARDVLRPVFGAAVPRHPWIQSGFARRVGLHDRLRPRSNSRFPTREQQRIYESMTSLVKLLGDEMEERDAQAIGVDQRHPFYDRRVAEFGLALPSAQRRSGREIKIVVRRALAGYLPPMVAARRDKAEFSHVYVDALNAIGGAATFATLRSEEAGWVDGAAVRRMYERMIELYRSGDDAYIACVGPLWAVAALEMWLEHAGGARRQGGERDESARQRRSTARAAIT